MKTTFALTALSSKLAMLLCVSCMGFFSGMSEVQAEVRMPCHQQVEEKKTVEVEPCEMCEQALESWDTDGVFSAEITDNFEPEIFFVAATTQQTDIFVQPALENYQVYFPPPEAQRKAVTPITKTIVLLV